MLALSLFGKETVVLQLKYGGDYLAFWSAGKVADEKGYSEIYNLENLKSVQMQALSKLGFLQKSILPAPYFFRLSYTLPVIIES